VILKVEIEPLPLIYPRPVVLVTTVGADGKPNIITLTLVGAVCWRPPVVGIGVGKNQHSRSLIDECGEFVVNMPRVEMLRDVEYCGLVSGRDVEKGANTGFTLVPSSMVKPFMIEECPLNLECRVKTRIPLGSNILFLGEVLRIRIEENILDDKGGVDLAKAAPIMFNLTNTYWSIGEKLADYDFTKLESQRC